MENKIHVWNHQPVYNQVQSPNSTYHPVNWHNYVESPCSICKSSLNELFSIAMLVYHRVCLKNADKTPRHSWATCGKRWWRGPFHWRGLHGEPWQVKSVLGDLPLKKKKKTFIEDFPASHVSLPGGYNCPRESRHSQASCHTIKVLQRAGHGNQLGIRADDHPMSSAFQSVSNSPILWSRCLILHIPPSDVAKWCVSAIFQWIGFHGKILTGKPH